MDLIKQKNAQKKTEKKAMEDEFKKTLENEKREEHRQLIKKNLE